MNILTKKNQNHLKFEVFLSWSRGYKTFFMHNLAEHEIFSANKYENANNSWHFHIY